MATYSILPNPSTVSEGETLQTLVQTTGVANGTVLFWSISGTNITANDFSVGALLGQARVVTDASGKGTFTLSHKLRNDLTTEGTETLQIKLFSNSTRTTQVGTTALVNVLDTSLKPTYTVTPSVASSNEGQVVTTTVSTTNVAAGTVLYWSLSGTGVTGADFSSGLLSGSGTVAANGQFSFAHTLANDATTEGPETVQIKLFSNAARTVQVGSTASYVVNDTSIKPAPKPTYTVSPAVAAVNEGLAVTTTVKTTNVPAGTVLYWAVSGTGITAADFKTGALTGFGTVAANGLFSFAHTLASDATTEGAETAQIKLFSDAARTVQVGTTASYVVNDTSLTPAPAPKPTYSVNPSLAAVNEGLVVTTTVKTTNVPAGTILYWALSGTGITASDFSAGALSGSGAVAANGLFSFAHTLANDASTEGPETVQIKLYSDAARTVQVGTTASYVVNDTSITPQPTYVVTPAVASIDEGVNLSTTVSTTNVSPGTLLYWQVSGTGITAADFNPGILSGSGSVDANGQFTISNAIASDFLTEGPETLQIKLFTDPAFTKQVGNTGSVVINDTFTTPITLPPTATFMLMESSRALNEGSVLNSLVHTTGLPTGTPLFWSIAGTGITDADVSGPRTGFGVTGANGMFSFSSTIANDATTEGTETLEIRLYADAARTKQVGTTTTCVISDTSTPAGQPAPLPTYALETSAVAVIEGTELTTTIKTLNVPHGTELYWTISGTNVTSQDFSSGTVIGSCTVGSTGQIQLTHVLSADDRTEGTETLQFNLYGDPSLSTKLATTAVSILDGSRAPGLETYELVPSATTINEGDTITFNVNTTNVPDGTILYYQIRGQNVSGLDLSSGNLFGQVLIKAGTASFSQTLAKDLRTEGDELLLVRLFSDKPGGTAIGSQVQVTVTDTSIAPNVATEIFQPKFTPFRVTKWASPLPFPTLKQADYVGDQPDIWGTNFAGNVDNIGGQPGLFPNQDPTQVDYHGIAPEFYNPDVAGTNTPYFTTGQKTSWYTQRERAAYQKLVDSPDGVFVSEIYGYDGTVPGSTFKTKVGQPIVVRHWNELPPAPGLPANMVERESIHLHGAHTPAHSDGYASFVINPGNYRDYYYPNTIPMGNDGKPDFGESPSNMWYHDHGEDITDFQVIKGMAGFWNAFDDIELDLVKNHVLPGWWKSTAEWNEEEFMTHQSPYDIPMALTDRRFNADGSVFYDGFPFGPNTDGYLGDVMMVNGQAYPFLTVEPTQYRLRMLDASTARIWNLHFEDESGVTQSHLRIGNDTWLLPHPVQMDHFIIGPAQRADVVMDFSGYTPGTVLYLVNTSEQNKGTGPAGDLLTNGTGGFSEKVMKIVVGERTATTPTNTIDTSTFLRDNTPILASEISNHRTFQFGRNNGWWMINQTEFKHDISNNPMPVGVAEEWTLINGGGGWWHPIHIHLESHQVQSINGIAPSPTYFPEKMYKSDTSLLGPNTNIVLYMKFRTFEGPFVFHCHILQHEDNMMMFNFDPNLDGAAYVAGDPIPADRDYTPYPFAHTHHPTVDPGSTIVPQPSPDAAKEPELSPILLTNFPNIVYGSIGADQMVATAQDSYLNGREGNDTIQGDVGNDMLVGGDGNDTIVGGAGDDLIAGEVGHDVLTGGAGRDGFYYVTADPFYNDVITDFEAGKDFVSIDIAIHNANGADATWTWIGSNSFDGAIKGQVRFVNELLQVDLDGNTYADINVLVQGIANFDPTWLNVPTVGTSTPTGVTLV